MAAATDEDVDVIGISVLSGAHIPLTGDLLTARTECGMEDLPIVVGGTVPPRDVDRLLEMGAADVFPVGTPIDDAVARVIQVARGTTGDG